MNIKRGAKSLLGLLIISAVLSSTLFASVTAQDFNLTASPLPVNISAKPGQTVTTPLRVQNTGSETVTINVSLKKFGPTDNSGKPSIVDPEEGDEFIDWVTFSETSFVAEPKVWHNITMTISPPKDAAFGYYYAVIFSHAGEQTTIKTEQLHSAVKGAIASLVLLDVDAPGAKRTLEVAEFSSRKKVYEYLPASFKVKVKNTGNVHSMPAGSIFVGKKGEQSLAALELNGARGNVLPGTEREFEIFWNDGFPVFKDAAVNGQVVSDENSKPKQRLDWSGFSVKDIRFGKYTAQLVMTYNDGTKDVPVEGSVSFWVIPWKFMLVTLVLILLLIAGLAQVFKWPIRLLKRHEKK